MSAEVAAISHTVALNGGGRWFVDDVLYNIQKTAKAEAYEAQKQGFLGFKQHILNRPQFDINVSGHGYNWWRDMFELDQTKIINGIDNPILLIQTQQDINVSPVNAALQAKSLMAKKENLAYLTYAGLDHGFRNKDGQRETQVVLDDIRAWLKQNQQ